MAPVLRDLELTGISPRIEDVDWADDPEVSSAMLWGATGGTGVWLSRSAPEFERVAMLADQIQEWAIEELWIAAPTNWPRCPRHPDSHPMKATTLDGAAVWTCPRDQVMVCRVGQL